MTDAVAPPESALDAEAIIAALDLKPHPEGGHYRETFRDEPAPAGSHEEPNLTVRPAATAIYLLLRAGEVSRWHAVDAAELWLWHAGAPLELQIAPPGEQPSARRLGFDLAEGVTPQAVVPARHWQRARSLGAWTLVTCTVAPGFLFDRFRLAPYATVPPFADPDF